MAKYIRFGAIATVIAMILIYFLREWSPYIIVAFIFVIAEIVYLGIKNIKKHNLEEEKLIEIVDKKKLEGFVTLHELRDSLTKKDIHEKPFTEQIFELYKVRENIRNLKNKNNVKEEKEPSEQVILNHLETSAIGSDEIETEIDKKIEKVTDEVDDIESSINSIREQIKYNQKLVNKKHTKN